jgi:hypothetical protein
VSIPPGTGNSSLRRPFELGATATRANQRFMVAIGQDQLQGLIGPEFFDSTSCHVPIPLG